MLLSNKDSFVIFRLPNSKDLYLIKGTWTQTKESSSTFILSEFKKNKTFFLSGKKENLTTDPVITTDCDLVSPIISSKKTYLETAQKFIELCSTKKVDKIILSRVIKETNTTNNIYSIFKDLCNKYNHSFNYVLNHPSLGMWMGASPEELITGNSKSFYSTTALAGSKKWAKNINWSYKETEEQRYVKQFIEKKLLKLTNEVSCDSDLKTVKAGNVAHLKSTFKFKTNKSIINLVNELHPTPAISGFPVKKAIENIFKHEQHSRELYCGYLGEISNETINLFVNLRCMKINKTNFFIYVGGGITNLSDANDEWEETQIKSQTLLSIVKK